MADRLGGPTGGRPGRASSATVCAIAYAGFRAHAAGDPPRFSARDSIRALRERPVLGRVALAQGFYGGGLIAALPLYALVYVDRLDLSLADVGIIGILTAAVDDGLVHRLGRRHRPARRARRDAHRQRAWVSRPSSRYAVAPERGRALGRRRRRRRRERLDRRRHRLGRQRPHLARLAGAGHGRLERHHRRARHRRRVPDERAAPGRHRRRDDRPAALRGLDRRSASSSTSGPAERAGRRRRRRSTRRRRRVARTPTGSVRRGRLGRSRGRQSTACAAADASEPPRRYDGRDATDALGGGAAPHLHRRRARATPSRGGAPRSTPPRRSRSSATRCSRRRGPGRTTRRSRRPGAPRSDPTEVLAGRAPRSSTRSRSRSLMDDGTRLVVLHRAARPRSTTRRDPGAVRTGDAGRAGAPTTASRHDLDVRNTSTRVIRVSSHYPFERVNQRLVFDRAAATGFRLRPPGRLDRALGTGRDADRPPRPVYRRRGGDGEPPLPGGTSRPVRADDRRPRPARRHRPLGPRRGGPPGARRRADLGLRQDHPTARDPGPAGPVGARRRRRRGARRRPGHRGRQGGHRHQGRPDRRGRARRQRADQRRHRPADRAAHASRSWATA